MRNVRFGRTGVEVPALSFGTWPHGGRNLAGDCWVGWSGHDDGKARAALVRAAEVGITHWDTADVYGDGQAENLIGSVWGDVPRERIFLASKVGWNAGEHAHFYHPDQIRQQMETTLKNLRVDHVDLYYLHHCNFGADGEYLDDALGLLRQFRDAGKIRFLGLSDWDLSNIMKYADRIQPDAIQPYRNVRDDAWESSGLKAWVDKHDVGVAFFSPLRHGLLLGKYDQPTTFPEGDFRGQVEDFRDGDLLQHLKRCRGAVQGRFPAIDEPLLHALVGALLEDAPTGCALVGLRNPAQVEAAARAGEALSSEDADWVRKLYRGEV